MKKFKTGVVCGKFYPPHRGHKFLIDSAAEQSERTVVLITDTPRLTIPVEKRAAWLQEIHPEVEVRIISDIESDDSVAWGKHTIEFLGWTPEAVFSSEDYGFTWAEAMGCIHVCVDKIRATFPISGTAVREDPLAAWDYLEPPVRAHFAKRVCVLGAESSGTTTLSKALAEHYGTAWVPEYGRFFSEGKQTSRGAEWRAGEFVQIAEQQSQMEDSLACSANRVLICDTDPFATSIWHERYLGVPSPEVLVIADSRHYDLYILTGDEIPFVQDDIRDGEHIRHQMHQRFLRALQETGRSHIVVTGSKKARLESAIAAIDKTVLQ